MAYPRRQYFETHHRALLLERLLPLWRWRDTAPRSFFRMYEGLCAHHDDYIGYETEYFWYRNDPAWTPEMLPDPREFGELAAGDASLADGPTPSTGATCTASDATATTSSRP